MFERVAHEVSIAVQGEFGQHAGSVGADRGGTNKQRAGNFFDRFSRSQHLEDLELSVRKNLMQV